jgi:multicomponent Na+:H+ antiporter subunit E
MRKPLTILALLLFWLVVVPPTGLGDVAVGLLAAVTLALWADRSLWRPQAGEVALHPLRALRYAATLVWRIVHAALGVLRIVFDPRLPIAPQVIRQTIPFPHEVARVAYANSISLTPGTLTVDVEGDTFTIHALAPDLVTEVLDGTLATEIREIFPPAPRRQL